MTTERLKVLFITHSFPRMGSGPHSNSLQLLADALGESGVDVRVVAPGVRSGDESGDEDGREDKADKGRTDTALVERFAVSASFERSGRRHVTKASAPSAGGTASRQEPRASRRSTLIYLGAGFGSAVKVRRDFEPDVVHAHWWFPSGLVGSWLSSLASLPLVTSLHGFDPQLGRAGSPARPLFRHVLSRSAAVTVESAAEARKLSGVLAGVTPVVAPIPLSSDLFRPADARRNLATVLCGGASAEDVAAVSETLRVLAESGADLALVADSSNDRFVTACVETAGVGKKTIIVAAEDSSALAAVLAESRVAVVHGAGDGQRATISAAMLSGAPLALVESEALRDLLAQQSRIATAVDGASAEERNNGLRALLNNPGLLKEQAEAARIYALATFAPESCAARLHGVYLRALGDVAA
jgi:glycosyltransferase involved in cell wall biosynthesis